MVVNLGRFFSCLSELLVEGKTSGRKKMLQELADKQQWVDKWPSEDAKENLANFGTAFRDFKQAVLIQESLVDRMRQDMEKSESTIVNQVTTLHATLTTAVTVVNDMGKALFGGADNDEELRRNIKAVWPRMEEIAKTIDESIRTLIDAIKANELYNSYLKVWIEVGSIAQMDIEAL